MDVFCLVVYVIGVCFDWDCDYLIVLVEYFVGGWWLLVVYVEVFGEVVGVDVFGG